jgi:hypothetical protein
MAANKKTVGYFVQLGGVAAFYVGQKIQAMA